MKKMILMLIGLAVLSGCSSVQYKDFYELNKSFDSSVERSDHNFKWIGNAINNLNGRVGIIEKKLNDKKENVVEKEVQDSKEKTTEKEESINPELEDNPK